MYFVDNNSAVPVMPAVKPVVSSTPTFFTEGGNGVPPTWPGPDWFNIVQTELLNVLNEAGIDPNKANHGQLVVAMKKLFLTRSNPFADIKADGAAAVALALSNLRLGAGAPAIGIPFFWPSAAMPNTVMDEWSDMVFLKWNGATFSATEYPKLALVIPGLKLQETRGEFIRVWDDGRGVDIGRTLLSAQQSSKLHKHVGQNGTTPSVGLLSVTNSDSKEWDTGWSVGSIPGFSSSSSGSDLQSFRPRNISFNFLVRAK